MCVCVVMGVSVAYGWLGGGVRVSACSCYMSWACLCINILVFRGRDIICRAALHNTPVVPGTGDEIGVSYSSKGSRGCLVINI